MFIDTHAHLDFASFDDDRDAVIQRAIENKLSAIITIGTSLDTSKQAIRFAENYASIYAAVGIHPSDCAEAEDKDYSEIEKLAKNEKVIAIGEVGLDYYRMYTDKDTQKAAFKRQIKIARNVNLPLIVHTRESQEDCIKILVAEKAGDVSGVLHSFSGSQEILEKALDTNFYISYTGGVTFKNSTTDELVANTPVERMLLETDSPFITPVPFRGKRNEPSYVIHTAKKIAEIKGLSVEELAKITTENARHLFGLTV
ncbi:MAG: TatD family deoxyribonuclease [Calditrichaeota bacterium]|nr:MAG: TatD family deoxyribonuclease [Calditrichota bacterium]MBL1206035.1 TatD family deoxyribonuclease [Calditrichota bacterium]NOG45863.1 TatD family hydrolase [Calditrichota bacterium]